MCMIPTSSSHSNAARLEVERRVSGAKGSALSQATYSMSLASVAEVMQSVSGAL